MKYDAAVGTDNTTLNNIVNSVYNLVYPNLFKNQVDVHEMGIASLGFDINAAPTVDLSPSDTAKTYIKDKLNSVMDEYKAELSDENISEIKEKASAALFGLEASSIVLTINYTNDDTPTQVQASLSTIVSIEAVTDNGENLLTAQIVHAAVSIPNDPDVQEILNKGIISGCLVPYLNENVLKPIQVPSLQISSLQISLPVPVVQSPYVTAYSALGAIQPDVPAPYNWPPNCLFIGTDSAVLTAAAAIPFPLGPSDGFNWKVISGEVRTQVLAPSKIVINRDGSLTATIVANALAQLTVHTPWPLPNFTFGPSATATLTVSLLPSVENNEVFVAVDGVPIPNFSFTWGGIPGWIDWFLTPLLDGLAVALNTVLNPLIGNALKAIKFSVYKIPVVSIDLAGSQINISVSDARTSTGGPDNSLFLVNGKVTVS